ncbi:MAG: MarR family transcriptional regulator [Pseudomonadota bacterium]
MPSHEEQVQRRFSTLVSRIGRQWRRALNEQLRPLGFTEATWLPLLHLVRAGEPMRQKDLAFSLTLDSSSVVRLLDELESAGLVERLPGVDRRVKTIHLTALGRETVAQVQVIADEARSRYLSVVPPEQLASALHVLEQVAEALAASELEPLA